MDTRNGDEGKSFAEVRATQYDYLDKEGHVYLDYTGSGLAARLQHQAHYHRLGNVLLGNPHSIHPPSAAATELVERTRSRILEHFGASPREYAVIFTPNATAAARLVGESYPFSWQSRLVLTADNHNSINGIRQFANKAKAKTTYVPFEPSTFHHATRAVVQALPKRCRVFSSSKRSAGLFAYPAQSNFTGVKHPLSWIEIAQARGYDVLLDAAAYVPTNRLDLSQVQPTFVTASWYKVFGYPTGVGCLIARRDSLRKLRRPWFSGGTVEAVTVGRPWELLARDEAAFEDGTVNFLSIPDVIDGLDWMSRLGIENIRRHALDMTEYCLRRLGKLRHDNGVELVKLHGPNSIENRGATIAFSVLDPSGEVIDDRIVGIEASKENISLRTGCFCNPGAAEAALGISSKMIDKAAQSRVETVDEFLQALNLSSIGVVRVSFGVASSMNDVDKLISFLEDTFCNNHVKQIDLGPRGGC